jgi:hypothetical protein
LESWSRGAVLAAAAFVASGTFTTHASAQSKPPPPPPSTFDGGRGPITGSTRYVGLGGAFVAIAEDTQGVAINPASDAVRLPYSWHAWDYGLGLDVSIGAWLPKNDIYNQPASSNGKSSALFGSVAAVINYNHAGFGLAAEAQANAATGQDQVQGITPTSLSANFGVLHASLAYGYLDGQLLLGAGARLVGTSFGSSSSSGLFSAAGVGYEAGFIVKPLASQFRLAAAVKAPINAAMPEGSSTVHVPWELSFGTAYQFGARRLNPRFVTARQVALRTSSVSEPSKAQLKAAEDELFETYQRQERFYLLVSTELTLVQRGSPSAAEQGSSAGDVAPRKGPVVSPRLGIESEVVPHILKLRGGTYYEAPRAEAATGRAHGTLGFDVRLFEWSIFGLVKRFDYWQLSVGADAARAYFNTAFSIGFWH